MSKKPHDIIGTLIFLGLTVAVVVVLASTGNLGHITWGGK